MEGQGAKAYMIMYKWFMGTAGLATGDGVKKWVSPNTPKDEAHIADMLDVAGGTQASGRDERRVQAARTFSQCSFGIHHERRQNQRQARLQTTGFDALVGKCREYGVKRRLEKHKRDLAVWT